jgi:Domain of unknown function (DUF3291)
MTAFQLAQINIAATKEPLESPVMADFVANLDRINELAEQSPGFVWRLKGEGNDATSLRPLGENVIVNMSVWDGIESLNAYVYRSAHTEIMRRRREWFDRMREMHMAMWWVRRGHQPTVDEAIGRLEHLRQHGPTGFAFTFRTAFPPPDATPAAEPFLGGDECPAT